MWGTHVRVQVSEAAKRFIPTHVGNSVAVTTLSSEETVHPHACGELIFTVSECHLIGGSSPRMWGTRHPPPVMRMEHRFIPTHVGNSFIGRRVRHREAVHPHACGELDVIRAWNVFKLGSSPRMWGTRYGDDLTVLNNRFIPTHVGNSDLQGRRYNVSPVHPHACGELVGPAAQPRPSVRFIPTHVGNSNVIPPP